MITVKVSQKKIKHWWVSLLLGVLYILLGIWILRTPLESYATLSLIFSAFIVLSGIFWIAFSISVNTSLHGWGWFLVAGILELVIGTLLIMHPAISLTILPVFIGFWLLFGGIIGIGSSLLYKSQGGKNWGWSLALSVFTILFSILLLANPIFTGIGVVFMTTLTLITLGIFRVIYAFNLRQLHKLKREEF